MDKIMHRERRLIEETVKTFIANQWCITPEAVWGFLQMHNEPVDFEKIVVILQEQHAESIKN